MEHGAVWHEAGGWAMRSVLGEPKAMVPAVKAVAVAGYRMMVPVHYIHASYVRSHFNSIEIGIQDAPRPGEILFALVMGTGGRVHSRLGGLTRRRCRRTTGSAERASPGRMPARRVAAPAATSKLAGLVLVGCSYRRGPGLKAGPRRCGAPDQAVAAISSTASSTGVAWPSRSFCR